MRMAELVRRSGVPAASVKFYLREGMLPPGEATAATQARYDEGHVRRLRLIKSLTGVAGLPLAKVKIVLGLIDEAGDADRPGLDLLGKAMSALPPYPAADRVAPGAPPDLPRARRALAFLGQVYEPGFVAVAQLERALAALEDAGIPLSDDRLAVYGRHIRAIAAEELAPMADQAPGDAVAYAVLGTVLHEPVLLALRRLAHQDLVAAAEQATIDSTTDRKEPS